MTSSAVVSRYANALADVVMGGAADGVQPSDASAQLQAFATLVQESSNLRNALISPSVSLSRKRAVILKLATEQGASRVIRNFLQLLSDHRRLDALNEIASAFSRVLDERLGFTRAEIQSAQPLRPQQQDLLLQRISQITGKNVRPTWSVNPDVLGGIVVNVGAKVYDGSVRGQLAAIGRRLVSR